MGTSMCYWRKTWENHPFPDYGPGCDDLDWFTKKVNIKSISAFQGEFGVLPQPRMIASVHGDNTCANVVGNVNEWKRIPVADGFCRKAMKL
jgi:hypothetical protein